MILTITRKAKAKKVTIKTAGPTCQECGIDGMHLMSCSHWAPKAR